MVNGISSNLIENFANFENFDNDTESKDRSGGSQTNNIRSNNEGEVNNDGVNNLNERKKSSVGNRTGTIGSYEGAVESDLDNGHSEGNRLESSVGNRSGTKVTYEDEIEGEGEGGGQARAAIKNNDGFKNYEGFEAEEEEEEDNTAEEEEVMEEFGALDKPIYEGFTNSDFNASNLVRGRNLHNLLKALLISLVLCSLTHKDVSKMVVDPLVKLVHNKLSHSTMVCVLVFVVSYLVIAFL